GAGNQRPGPHRRHHEGRHHIHQRHRARPAARLSRALPLDLPPGRDREGHRKRQHAPEVRQPHPADRPVRTYRRDRVHAGALPAAEDALTRPTAPREPTMAVAPVPDDLGLAAEPDPRVRYRRVLVARLAVVVAVLAVWQAVIALGWVDAFWISSPSLVV